MSDLLAAICLVLIFEGLLLFASPSAWRDAMRQLASLDDRTLRTFGGGCMLVGLIALNFVR